jgi:hypothetical protein
VLPSAYRYSDTVCAKGKLHESSGRCHCTSTQANVLCHTVHNNTLILPNEAVMQLQESSSKKDVCAARPFPLHFVTVIYFLFNTPNT